MDCHIQMLQPNRLVNSIFRDLFMRMVLVFPETIEYSIYVRFSNRFSEIIKIAIATSETLV